MARIVVIDDEPVLRLTFRYILEQVGHQVWDAENGRVGVEICRTAHPDLVITDMIMPEQEGLETVEILSREFPGMPIIAMSGAGAESPDPANERVQFVVKPLDRPVLLNLVEQMISATQS